MELLQKETPEFI